MGARKPVLGWQDVSVTESGIYAMTRLCIHGRNTIWYYQKTDDEYLVYCTCCQEYHRYSPDEWKKTRYANVCPHCFTDIKKYRNVEKHCTTDMDGNYELMFEEYIMYQNAGFWVCCESIWGELPKLLNYEQVYFHDGMTGNNYVQHISLRMMANGIWYNPNSKLHKTSSYYYSANFWSDETMLLYMNDEIGMTKREYLEKYADYIEKSNQKKMVIDNIFSYQQMVAIYIFDLKDPMDVYRNRVWIRDNIFKYSDGCWRSWGNNREEVRRLKAIGMTPTTLKYLKKNKISLSDYQDYASMCRTVGRKIDRPKEFMLWHDRLTVMKDCKLNESLEKGISDRWDALKEFTYSKGNITIKSFSCYEEICVCASKLHNCMARMYAKPFSEGKTDLYHLDIDGIPTIAIEINRGRLIQARTDHNGDCPAKLRRTIEKWRKEVYESA